MNRIELDRLRRAMHASADALVGRFRPLQPTLDALAHAPMQLGFEFTNLCNANCVFCPYQHQQRAHEFMSDAVFEKGLADFVALGGGNVELTPVVGDPLIHRDFVPRVRRLRAQPAIRRIWVVTNGILIDQHGADALLDSGLTAITISTAGFDEAMYQRVYRSSAYQRMRRNVLALAKANAARSSDKRVELVIALRPDRPLKDVLADPDFQPILACDPPPVVRAIRAFSDAGGRIPAEQMPGTIPLRVMRPHTRPCAYTFYGPEILSDGSVIVCNCLASMDARDLVIGNILTDSLADLWRGERLRAIRASFGTAALNPTCASCTMYHDTGVFRRSEFRSFTSRSGTS